MPPPPEERLTKTSALQAAAAGLRAQRATEAGSEAPHEAVISGSQFDDYVRVGLVAESRRGIYPAGMVERLMRSHELGQQVHLLAQRVVRLRAEPLFWTIEPEKLRGAMVELAPTLTGSREKMRQVCQALAAVERQLPAPAALTPLAALGPRWKPPPRHRWGKLLQGVALNVFQARSEAQYHLALDIMPVCTDGTGNAISTIPFEERVILLTVRDLAARLALPEAMLTQERSEPVGAARTGKVPAELG